jgi:CubicO group peptidase (beta-lactamase class C family)
MFRKIAYQIGFLTLIIALFSACQSKPVATPLSSSPTPAAQTTPPPPLNADEVAAFFDELMPEKLIDYKSAGAVVSVVANGKIIFNHGYGYANLQKQIPADPEKTLLRIASVSKLFTWTAVMQLVEQGKIDLAANINDYLDFEIPTSFPQPITMNDLMSHTAGFEEDSC